MLRFLLIFAVINLAGWSQPTQQQAQPPIIINNVPPHEGFWTGLLKLAIPTIVAAALASGITLYGVNKTHKHQATENEANREHQLQVEIAKAEIAAKYKSQDRRWEFRKDIYSGLVKAICDMTLIFNEFISEFTANCLDTSNPQVVANWLIKQKEFETRLRPAATEYYTLISLSPLATATWQGNDILEISPNLEKHDITVAQIVQVIKDLSKTLDVISKAGRKDLWGTPEPEANAEGAKQT